MASHGVAWNVCKSGWYLTHPVGEGRECSSLRAVGKIENLLMVRESWQTEFAFELLAGELPWIPF